MVGIVVVSHSQTLAEGVVEISIFNGTENTDESSRWNG